MSVPVYRGIKLTINSAELRTAEFQGRPYLVFPVVALMEGVVYAANAEKPEFVPAEVLQRAPASWNGRPVMFNHPQRDGEYVSANAPDLLELESFGFIFSTFTEQKKLKMEAWLDESRAEVVGAGAMEVLERAKKSEPVEISVGAFVIKEEKIGTYKGKKYYAEWKEIIPDHLALLEKGAKGACSNDMGCGIRAAHAHLITAEGIQVEEFLMEIEQIVEETNKRSLKDRFLALVGIRAALSPADMSDVDIRSAIDKALRASEPGYLGIERVYPDKGLVVFAIAPGDKVQLIRNKFKVAEDGTVTFGTKRVEVRSIQQYEPVTAAEDGGETETGCGCKDKQTPPTVNEGAQSMDKKAIVQALIKSKKNPYTEADAAVLEQMSETTLKALQEADEKAPAPETPAPAPAPAPTTPTTPSTPTPEETRAAFLAANPDVAEIINVHKAQQTARRNELVTALKGAQSVYTEAELQTRSIDELEKLATLAKAPTAPVDFAARGVSRPTPEDDRIPPPGDLIAALKAAQQSN
jgi:hypothetical protein